MKDSPFTSRKLWVTVLGMAICAWLRSRGLIGDDAFTTVMVSGMLGYPAANVAQKVLWASREP